MNTHSTNYTNTFIQVAEDCPAKAGEAPPDRESKSAARQIFERVTAQPYHYTSDDLQYETAGKSKGISREDFFSKGQPCLRASALPKRYGWGIHSDGMGRVALYALGTPEYQRLSEDPGITQLKAMRNNRGGT